MLPQFDRNRLIIKPLSERVHDLTHVTLLLLNELPAPLPDKATQDLAELGRRLVKARERKAAILMLMGAHVIRAGVARQLIDLMERGLVTHVGMNGAGPIHDYELARIGATCESVARYIKSGEFGLWRETGEINDIVRKGAAAGLGLGEAIGKAIHESDFRYKDTSVLAAGYRLKVPVTVHIGIGYDIIHEHPNFDPAAFGTASYRDFLAVCDTVSRLEGGVFLCFGSAVMGPEVYLKALAMARNLAHQEGRKIAQFTTAAFDLIPVQGEWHEEAPKSDPQYYYRPWKTILVRTVADGGESFYVCGDHRQTVPYLRKEALAAEAAFTKTAAVPATKTTSIQNAKPAATPAKPAAPPAEPAAPAMAKAAAPPPKAAAPAMAKAAAPAPKAAAAPAKPTAPPAKPTAAPAKTAAPPVAKATPPAVAKATPPAVAKVEARPVAKTAPVAAKTVPVAAKTVPVLARTEAFPAAKTATFPVRKLAAENLEAAVSHYAQLKDWVRTNNAADLEWYETKASEGWHYSTITKENYLRLFFRIVWTSGSKSEVVIGKEDAYFRVVHDILYPQGCFNPKRQTEFLGKVASVLGGSSDNRKNKAVFHVINLVESLGWDEFRRRYASPQSDLAERLQEFPMIGAKTAKLLLNQMGIADADQDDEWVAQFAAKHGYAEPDQCIREISGRTGDSQTTIDFVLREIGDRKELLLKS